MTALQRPNRRCCTGVHAVKLEELERRLRNDLMQEAVGWQGRLLLHREVPLPPKVPAQVGHDEDEDVTRAEDLRPEAAVAAFWESLGAPPDSNPGSFRAGILFEFKNTDYKTNVSALIADFMQATWATSMSASRRR